MKSPKMIIGAALMLAMSAQAFSQTDTTKKDTTKHIALVTESQYLQAFDTIPKKDTSTKDTTKMFAYGYAVLDTVPKDTTKKDSLNLVARGPFSSSDDYLILDTIPKKDTSTKDTTRMFAYGYAVLDTVPKDTTKKPENLTARGPFSFEENYIVLDTVPTDTTKKPSGWGSLAPLPKMDEITEFKSSAPAPNAGKYYVAVLGNYQPEGTTSTTTTTDQNASPATTSSNVTVTVDDQNPGKIWVEGVGSSKFYAYLKNDANVYKIPAQKVDDKKVEEGIVAYNEATKEIHVRIGSGYNDADPNVSLTATEAVASTTETVATKPTKKGNHVAHAPKKAPKKIISFDGTKTDTGTAAL